MTWAWSQQLRPTTKLVLMSLSDIANDSGQCFPSIRHLAQKCSLSPRHTRREIQKLEDLDLMSIQKRIRKDGSHSSNLYLLHLAKSGGDNLSPPQDRTICQQVVTAVSGGHDSHVTPLTTKEPLINPTATEHLHWPEQLSDSERESIQKLVVGFSDEIVQQLLDELAGQIKSIKNPIAYFFTILNRYKNGKFIPSNSLRVKADRKTRRRNQRALDNASKLHLKRLREYGIKVNIESE